MKANPRLVVELGVWRGLELSICAGWSSGANMLCRNPLPNFQLARLEPNPMCLYLQLFLQNNFPRKSISLEVENETTLKKSLSKDEGNNLINDY